MSHKTISIRGHTVSVTGNQAAILATELSRMPVLRESHAKMLKALERLEESSSYWSEYDVPIGIAQDIKDTIKEARRLS